MKISVKIDDQTFEVEVGDLSARPILATLEGETFEVWPEEPSTAQTPTVPFVRPQVAATVTTSVKIAPTGPINAPADLSKVVTAPIPGTIISIMVKEGDHVIAGQEICSLEAMKMKNAIRANHPGTIARIMINPGDRVSQGQPLVEYAD
ncbi:MAG: biotin/lipoyl-binding protein [Methanothrix sp.]|nr:biotin/lipoyl-binding protein [Methanothrix sp.]